MFLSVFDLSTSRTRRVCVIVVGLSVLGAVTYCVTRLLLYAEARTSSAVPAEWYTAELRTDRPRLLTRADVVNEMPNLPDAYSTANFLLAEYRVNATCAPYPGLFQLSFHNLYWQTLPLPAGDWHVFAAYYENRTKSDVKPAVRVLVATGDLHQNADEPFCQIWFPRLRKPVLTRSRPPELVFNRFFPVPYKYAHDRVRLWLVTCPIPAVHVSVVPNSVSLVPRQCDAAKNHLKVIYDKAPGKRDFAVCVTALNFFGVDYSVRLAEWIELVHLLGADRVFVYYHHHHENVTKVLEYYERQGKVQLHRFGLPADQPNLPIVQNLYLTGVGEYLASQFVGLQDCLYRNMYNYKYMTTMDVDEVIVPLAGSSWKELMEHVESTASEDATEYCVQNFWFHDDDTYPGQGYSDVPHYLHMLRHVRRTTNAYTVGRTHGYHPKCFRKPETVKVEGNHGPAKSFSGGRKTHWIPPSEARLQHYCDRIMRNRCTKVEKSSVVDTSIWRYKEALIERVLPTLNTLGFLNA